MNIPTEMKCIPGGPFIRGSELTVQKLDTGKRVKDESPIMTVTVSTFLIDTLEVTLREFKQCVKAAKCSIKPGPKYGWARRNLDNPALGMSWFAARNYCRWKGKRLPTEAEWEKAARGSNGDQYPWGNEAPTCKRAIIKENGRKGCGTGITHKVGSRPAYRYGLKDMAGNAHEWVSDWYSDSYGKCGKACTGTDPKGPCNGADQCPGYKRKVVRGGSWYWPPNTARSSWRRPHYPDNYKVRYHHFGFRCAKSVSAP